MYSISCFLINALIHWPKHSSYTVYSEINSTLLLTLSFDIINLSFDLCTSHRHIITKGRLRLRFTFQLKFFGQMEMTVPVHNYKSLFFVSMDESVLWNDTHEQFLHLFFMFNELKTVLFVSPVIPFKQCRLFYQKHAWVLLCRMANS